MKVGLLARADSRGLGHMSWDAQRFLSPHRTVIVDAQQGHDMHPERFPDAPIVLPDTPNFREACLAMLSDIDVLLTLETPYDYSLYTWARELNVPSVLVCMPEYYAYRLHPDLPRPDVVVNPTTYMQDSTHADHVLPWPVDTSAIPYVPRKSADVFLHVVGQHCAWDRNGTRLVLDAFRLLPGLKLVARSQVPYQLLRKGRSLPNVTVMEGETRTVADLFSVGDVLVYPRRYAGNSLLINEAQANGLPLICLARNPEKDWTILPALCPTTRDSTTRRGFHVYDASPRTLAHIIERLAESPDLVEALSLFSRKRALSISWNVMLPLWQCLLSTAYVTQGTHV